MRKESLRQEMMATQKSKTLDADIEYIAEQMAFDMANERKYVDMDDALFWKLTFHSHFAFLLSLILSKSPLNLRFYFYIVHQ